jgi:glycerol kinase
MRETTALGAAIAAGFAVGVWKEFDELKEINQKNRMVFKPNVGKEVGEKMFKKWGRVRDIHEQTTSETYANIISHFQAVEMCRGWLDAGEANGEFS